MISQKTTASTALDSLLTSIQITNKKLEHLFSLSALLLIYCMIPKVENEGHFRIKPITENIREFTASHSP